MDHHWLGQPLSPDIAASADPGRWLPLNPDRRQTPFVLKSRLIGSRPFGPRSTGPSRVLPAGRPPVPALPLRPTRTDMTTRTRARPPLVTGGVDTHRDLHVAAALDQLASIIRDLAGVRRGPRPLMLVVDD